MVFAVLVVLSITLAIIFYFYRLKLNHGLPPGPRGIPLLGNLLQMGAKPHLKLSQWAQEYGKMYTIYLAHKPTLVVNDQKLLKELFGLKAATGKFKTEVIMLLTQGSYGIGNAEGDVWVEQKQNCMRFLKNFGFGRRMHMEPLILKEVEDLCSYIDSSQDNGGKVYLAGKLQQLTTNIMWTVVSGQRMISHESEIVALLDKLVKYFQMATTSGLVFFSWIKYFAPDRSGYNGIKATMEKVHHFVNSYFENNRKTRVQDEPPRDMIDAYIEKVENCTDKDSSFYKELGWTHSVSSVQTLLVAGGETTGSMLNWMIFYLSAYSQVQEKLKQEVDTVIGRNVDPCLEQKSKMPYTEAVILETLRLAAFFPIGLIHELVEDIEFQGYRLPKGLLLMANLYHAHRDKAVWGDAEVFRPERFIQEEGKLKEFIVAFQPGKRSCPGEHVAKDVLFLFITKLMQTYTFHVDPDVENICEYFEPDAGFVLMPRKLPISATLRV